MAHFAEIDADGMVTQIIVIANRNAPDPAPRVSEPAGQAFIRDVLGLPGTWVQTSYTGAFRKRYASVGGTYDANADVFITAQPSPSWVLDSNFDWQPPTPMPTDDRPWQWDESGLSWVEITA